MRSSATWMLNIAIPRLRLFLRSPYFACSCLQCIGSPPCHPDSFSAVVTLEKKITSSRRLAQASPELTGYYHRQINVVDHISVSDCPARRHLQTRQVNIIDRVTLLIILAYPVVLHAGNFTSDRACTAWSSIELLWLVQDMHAYPELIGHVLDGVL